MYSLTRNDFLWHSLVPISGIHVLLKEFLTSGESLSKTDLSFDSTLKVSRLTGVAIYVSRDVYILSVQMNWLTITLKY